ncbi:hypothetical protein [Streptomyces sp. NPDC098781]|uniref:hypothetical protein n=1 Tax=Streptomyces sp. NPDC098781 TaxID=3366097 RepID=UPI00383015C5
MAWPGDFGLSRAFPRDLRLNASTSASSGPARASGEAWARIVTASVAARLADPKGGRRLTARAACGPCPGHTGSCRPSPLTVLRQAHTMTCMRFLRRVRRDLARGENLEIYSTALLSVTLAVLGAFDVVGGKVLDAATLATLALLAGGLLGSRRQVSDLAQQVRSHMAGEVSAEDFLTRDKPDLIGQVRDARDIRIVGVTLSRTLRNLVDELQSRAAAGATIKVALIDPATSAPAEAARRSTVSGRPAVFENRLRPSVDLLRELVESPGTGGRIAVRFLPFVPAFGLVLLDPQRPGGRIHVDIYSHSSASGDAVFTVLPDRDGHWYQHFQAEFDRIWAFGRPADASDGFPPPPPA